MEVYEILNELDWNNVRSKLPETYSTSCLVFILYRKIMKLLLS